ncbi:MAG: hypothetical protein JXX29_04540 [Deltaproteobacteria bacterium]|nr:hypothetical protein [Deltaproteobacteria bacterium]MBN2670913.1 hypothetical protein [Deltaproteobacteria bacterium]
MKASIDSQLMDYNMTSTLQLLDEPLPTTQEPLEIGRQYQMLTNSLAIFWIQDYLFYLYIHDGEDSHFFSRPLPESSSNWELQCDAIASVVHAVISSWLAPPEPAELPTAATDENQPVASETDSRGKNSSEKTANENSQNTSSNPPPPFLPPQPYRISIGLMYSGCIMSSDNPWVNGAAISLNFRLEQLFLIGVESGFATVAHSSFRMNRVPIRAKAGVRLDKMRFTFGGDISVFADITRVRNNNSDEIPNAGQTYLGIGFGGIAAFHLSQRISIVTQLDVNISRASNIYWDNDEAIFFYGPFQGRLGIGLIFRI